MRAVIATGESAAEARNLSGLMDLVSPRYEDGRGGSAVELSRTLRGYFIANQSVHLLTRVESVEFPYKDMARVHLTVGTLGRKAGASDTIDLAADLQDVHLELQLERGEWKVTRAEWQPVFAPDQNEYLVVSCRRSSVPSSLFSSSRIAWRNSAPMSSFGSGVKNTLPV